MRGGAALAAHQVDDHVDGRNEDDEIAERDDLAGGGHGDDVRQHHELVVVSFDVATAGELGVVLEAGIDDAGLHECLGTDRHALVDQDWNDVCAQADGHDPHAGEVEVREREAGKQHEREEHQCSREITTEPRCDDLTGDATHEESPLVHTRPCEAGATSR
jgi:hypothetical protein